MCTRAIALALTLLECIFDTDDETCNSKTYNMCRWARGKARLDTVRNVDTRKEAHMYPMVEFHREKMLRWFGHVQRRDKEEAARKILQMAVDGKRNRGRPKLRWRDLMKEDIARNQTTIEMAENRKHWHVMISAGTLRGVEGIGEKKTTGNSRTYVCQTSRYSECISLSSPSSPDQATSKRPMLASGNFCGIFSSRRVDRNPCASWSKIAWSLSIGHPFLFCETKGTFNWLDYCLNCVEL